MIVTETHVSCLQQYTVTSDVQLQCRVLLLLSQLVQLRVNYCLLDSDQIFIGFVLKQFEFIEEGQIPYVYFAISLYCSICFLFVKLQSVYSL